MYMRLRHLNMRLSQMTMLPVCGVIVLLFQGCAANTSQGGDDHLQKLEKEMMQLKAENANLQARTRELDDKVLLYEKKQSLEGKKSTRDNMRTVRLLPEGNVMEAPAEEESSVSFKEQFGNDDERPVLRLNESSFASYNSDQLPVTNASNPATPRPWSDIPATNQGDNLGVLSADGQLQQAEADSMELFNAAYRSYNNRDYPAALAGFSAFLQRESNHRFADNAMFWIAECHLAQGKLIKAVGEFERLLRRYPSSEQAASSLYRIGFIYDQMNDAAKASEYYFKVVEKYPGSEAARKASRRMSESGGNARLVRTSSKR